MSEIVAFGSLARIAHKQFSSRAASGFSLARVASMRTDIIKFLTLEETTRLLPELASNRRDQAGRDDPAQRLQGEFKAEGKVRTLAEIKPFLLGGAEPRGP